MEQQQQQQQQSGGKHFGSVLQFNRSGSHLALASAAHLLVYSFSANGLVQFAEGAPSHSAPIRTLAFSGEGDTLVSSGDDKTVYVWDTSVWSSVKSFVNGKKLSTVLVAGEGQDAAVICADMFGEVRAIPLSTPSPSTSATPEEPVKPKIILGHVSIIHDMVLTAHGDYILTADRDDKIRVSHYPKAYNIETYCLGHTKFVTKLVLPSGPETLVVSGSGDGTLRLWNYLSGRPLHTVTLQKGALPVVVPAAISLSNDICVFVEGDKQVRIFRIDGSQLVQTQVIDVPSVVVDAAFNPVDNSLWVSGLNSLSVFGSEAGSYVSSDKYATQLAAIHAQLDRLPLPAMEERAVQYARWEKRPQTHRAPDQKKRRTDNDAAQAQASK